MNSEQTREMIKKVRQIEIRTNRLVTDTLAGQYHSVFKGRGMNFDAVREYVPGDEVRTIDWNVTARAGRPFVKKFVEERELTLLLMVDVSASGDFGSGAQSKRELAAEIASVLAFSAVKNSDKVGLLLFTNKVELYLPPRKGRRHVLRIVREVLGFEPAQRVERSVERRLWRQRRDRAARDRLLLSDFQTESDGSIGLTPRAAQTNRRHDLVALPIEDARERRCRSSDRCHRGRRDRRTSKSTRAILRAPAFHRDRGKPRAPAQRTFNAEAVDPPPRLPTSLTRASLMTFLKTAPANAHENSHLTILPLPAKACHRRRAQFFGLTAFAAAAGGAVAPPTVTGAHSGPPRRARRHPRHRPDSIQPLSVGRLDGGSLAAPDSASVRGRCGVVRGARVPYEIALESLAKTRGLMQPENAQRFSLAVSEIVRLFIEECLPVRAAHRTTHEFLRDLVNFPNSPLAAHRETLRDFLHHCDLAKFARWSLTVPRMEAMLESANAFVIDIGKPKAASKQPVGAVSASLSAAIAPSQ
jgi:hypothetical protein